MLILTAAVILLVFYGTKIARWGEFQREYHSPGKTNALKGIFVLFVFASHVRNYLALSGWDLMAFWPVNYVGQLMVAPFLFWSGFGIMESVRRKGAAYVRGLPKNRCLRMLVHFDCALILFLLVRLIIQKKVTLTQFLLSLICWDTIGNSNWFVFAIIVLYLLTTFAFLTLRRNERAAAALMTMLTVVTMAVLSFFKEEHWYNTMLCYCLGMWYSILRTRIEAVALKDDWRYMICLLAAGAAFCCMRMLQYRIPFGFSLYGIVFMMLLVLLSMKISPDNRFLQYLGDNVFEIYILQRIPMRLMLSFGIAENSPAVFVLLSFGFTCILAFLFRGAMNRLDGKLFAPRKVRKV